MQHLTSGGTTSHSYCSEVSVTEFYIYIVSSLIADFQNLQCYYFCTTVSFLAKASHVVHAEWPNLKC
jgi:hypothetical protein